MAKEKADKKAKKTEKVEKAEKAPEFKYGVSDLAEKLGIEPASARVRLRNAGIEKAGKSYGWNSKSDLQEVVDQLKAEPKAKAEKPAKKDKAEKPAKGKDAKAEKKGKDKPAKKGKKAAADEDD